MFDKHQDTLFEKLKPFVNENRVNAVLSKLNDKQRASQNAVFFFIAKDAFEDIFIVKEVNEVAQLSKKDKNAFEKRLAAYTGDYCDLESIDFRVSS